MESPELVIGLIILFVIIGVSTSVIYYFARYYVKTDATDKELLTPKPLEWGVSKDIPSPTVPKDEPQATTKGVLTATAVLKEDVKSPSKVTPKKNLSEALAKTRNQFWGRLSLLNWMSASSFAGPLRDEIEEIIYTSDVGPAVAESFLSHLQTAFQAKKLSNPDEVKLALRAQMLDCFATKNSPLEADLFAHLKNVTPPAIWMVVGVNGAGKTTTIGKLASQARERGLKVLIVAGDTFRAAADSQLKVWAERAGCEIYSAENTKDPGAVAYAGVERAKAIGAELVIIDTAGRLHTQDHLMEELKKIRRVVAKIDPQAPHERILVIDANAGQNALEQARRFHAAVDLTSVIATKMDGSSKAGVLFGIAQELQRPISYIGIGEAVEDLKPFDPQAFVEAIL